MFKLTGKMMMMMALLGLATSYVHADEYDDADQSSVAMSDDMSTDDGAMGVAADDNGAIDDSTAYDMVPTDVVGASGDSDASVDASALDVPSSDSGVSTDADGYSDSDSYNDESAMDDSVAE